MVYNTVNFGGMAASTLTSPAMTLEEEVEHKRKKYEICKQRGHKPSNVSMSTGDYQPTLFNHCVYCGTRLRYEEPTEGRWVEVEG